LSPSGPSLLLVAADGAEAGVSDEALRAAVPGAVWTRCPSVDAAAAYLAAATFDAVVIDEAAPGVNGSDGPELGERLGTPVHVFRGSDGAALRGLFASGVRDAAQSLSELRVALARAIHQASNPLTVITGNAQYALEMARTMELDTALVKSLEDIEEAGRRLEGEFAALSALRQRLGTAHDSGDALA
jgi:signal transduction histidine kinase